MYLKYLFVCLLLVTLVIYFYQKNTDTQTTKNFSKIWKAEGVASIIQNKNNLDENFVVKASKMKQQGRSYLLEKLLITSGNKELQAQNAILTEDKLRIDKNASGKWNDFLYSAQQARWDFKNQKITLSGSFVLTKINPKTKLTAKTAIIQKDTIQVSGNVRWQSLEHYMLQTEKMLLTTKTLQSHRPWKLENKKTDYLLTANSFAYDLAKKQLRAKNNVIFKNKDQSLMTQELLFSISNNSIATNKKFIFDSSKDNIRVSASTFFYDLSTKKIQVKDHVTIELEKFLVLGQDFVLDFNEQTIISQHEVQIKDKTNNFELLSKSFFYNLKDQSLLVNQ